MRDMKLSLKFREETTHKNPLLRAKIPVTILGLPFLSGVVAGDALDVSFSLRSNFSTGPCLSLSYHPTLSPPPSSSSTFPPFSLSLKSGIGLFGSPKDSPLTFSATFNPNNPLTPTFSLFIKPQFGNFSLFKAVDSGSVAEFGADGQRLIGGLANGSVLDLRNGEKLGDGSEKGGILMGLKREREKHGILSGIFVAARTAVPVAKRAVVNFRWGVNFPQESWGSKLGLPVLVMNKISVERVEEGKKVEEEKKKKVDEAKAGDLELLKGMCGWMTKEVEGLQRENREMRLALESMRLKSESASRWRGEDRENVGRKVVHSQSPGGGEGLSEFEKWRGKKSGSGGEESGSREVKKSSSSGVSDLESELPKAIKAASS